MHSQHLGPFLAAAAPWLDLLRRWHKRSAPNHPLPLLIVSRVSVMSKRQVNALHATLLPQTQTFRFQTLPTRQKKVLCMTASTSRQPTLSWCAWDSTSLKLQAELSSLKLQAELLSLKCRLSFQASNCKQDAAAGSSPIWFSCFIF